MSKQKYTLKYTINRDRHSPRSSSLSKTIRHLSKADLSDWTAYIKHKGGTYTLIHE